MMEIKAAAYARLSREDKNDGESLSIETQKMIIESFAQSQGIEICGVYVDDGYSGTNFERPAFKSLMNDIYGGKINCVIVKDLSRFGRNYAESGMYLERVFPYLNVRFIAVSDDYDSDRDCGVSEEMLLIFKNLINDIYAADISVKTKSSLYAKMKRGDYIGAFAAYGYRKEGKELLIDEYAASVVRFIFFEKIKGFNNKAIAEILNRSNVPAPADYKLEMGESYRCGFKMNLKSQWSALTVRRILENEIYTGKLIQGKTKAYGFRSKKRVKTDGIVSPIRHTAIISQDIFEDVRRIMERDTRTAEGRKDLYLLSGIIFCGVCGGTHIRRKNGKYVYYMCGANKNDKNVCSSNRVCENAVMEKIKGLLGEIPVKRENIVHFVDKIYVYRGGDIRILQR